MNFRIADNVRGFLEKKGKQDLTVWSVDLETPCCVGRLPELKTSFDPPEHPGEFRHFSSNGLQIHLAKQLKTDSTLDVSLAGFGPFKKIEVSGINLVL